MSKESVALLALVELTSISTKTQNAYRSTIVTKAIDSKAEAVSPLTSLPARNTA